LGWALWRPPRVSPADGETGQGRPPDVWSLRFEKPGGGEFSLTPWLGQPLLLNFWATWCPPCVEEMPLLERFQRDYRATGWRVVGLAVDNAASVLEFLAAHPVTFAIGLAGLEGLTLSRALGNERGALPFSAAFNPGGEPVERRLGALTWEELTTWARRVG
jgi:thiol-disulfide isomerase/thioredoxin